jgi:hypothetical protein
MPWSPVAVSNIIKRGAISSGLVGRGLLGKLAVRGSLTERTGKPFVAAQVAKMLRGSE